MTQLDRDVFEALKTRMKHKFPILLEGYLRDAREYISRIDTNINGGDIIQIIEAAHSLKSASGLLGLRDLHHESEHFEYAGKAIQESGQKDYQNLYMLYTALNNAFCAIEDRLQEELKTITKH